MSTLTDGWLDDFGYQRLVTFQGSPYERGDGYGPYSPIVFLHKTDTTDFSRDSIRRHTSPPQIWANYQRGELTQTGNLHYAGRALYQQQFGESWMNKHYYCLQCEWVGKALYEPTESDDELKWVAGNVVVPLVLFLRSIGLGCRLETDPNVPMGGAASETWRYRYNEQQWQQCNWVTDHAHAPHQDHWDVGATDKPKIVAYAKADPRLSGIVNPPVPTPGDDEHVKFSITDEDGSLYLGDNNVLTGPYTGYGFNTVRKAVEPQVLDEYPPRSIVVDKKSLSMAYQIVPPGTKP